MRVLSAGPACSAGGSETAVSPTAKKRRKSYARRTCQSCRARKQRCEFPEASLLIAPSDEALQEHLACSRCRALDVPCLLNDFERGARLEVERDGQAPEGQAAPQRRRRSRAKVRGPPAEQGELNGAGNKDESQPNEDVANDQLRKLADVHPKDVDQVEEFFNRRRPITILVELVSRQPKFGTALRDSVAMEDLVDDEMSQAMSDWTEKEVVLWLPFMPSPWSVRLTRRQGQPQQSKVDLVALELLEVVQYAVAAQHMAQVDGPLRRSITMAAQSVVENRLGPLMLSSPSSVEAAQALQLLAAFPVVFGDPGPMAGIAKRMSLASQRTANLNYKFRDGTFADIEADLESYVFFCSACVWDDVYSYGSDDYFVFHKSDWLLKETKIIEHLEELSRRQTRRGREGGAGERRRNLGKMCVLLRALCMAYAAKSWVSTDSIEMGGDPVARTRQLDVCLEAWQYDMSLFRARLEQHLGSDGRGQESVADDDERRCRQRMLDWLIVESSTAHLTVSAKVFVRACEADITPNYIRNLIFGIDVHDAVRLFSFKHGDPRMDACETVMATMTRMATLATEQGARAQDKDHSLYPSALASGYLLQAATLAMDMFSTSLKFFKSMPRRADSWRLAFGGAVRFAEALTRTPIEEGGTAAASAKLVAGMLDIIAIWERALMASRVAGGVTPSSSATAATGGRSAGTTSSSDGRDVHHIPAPTAAAAAAAAPLSASTDYTSGGSSDTPATTAPPQSIFDSLEPNEWSQFGTLPSSDGIHATLWNTDTLQTMMNDVFGRTDWGDVLAELEGENLSMFPGLAS